MFAKAVEELPLNQKLAQQKVVIKKVNHWAFVNVEIKEATKQAAQEETVVVAVVNNFIAL